MQMNHAVRRRRITISTSGHSLPCRLGIVLISDATTRCYLCLLFNAYVYWIQEMVRKVSRHGLITTHIGSLRTSTSQSH